VGMCKIENWGGISDSAAYQKLRKGVYLKKKWDIFLFNWTPWGPGGGHGIWLFEVRRKKLGSKTYRSEAGAARRKKKRDSGGKGYREILSNSRKKITRDPEKNPD